MKKRAWIYIAERPICLHDIVSCSFSAKTIVNGRPIAPSGQ
jgi:hypothetical protein